MRNTRSAMVRAVPLPHYYYTATILLPYYSLLYCYSGRRHSPCRRGHREHPPPRRWWAGVGGVPPPGRFCRRWPSCATSRGRSGRFRDPRTYPRSSSRDSHGHTPNQTRVAILPFDFDPPGRSRWGFRANRSGGCCRRKAGLFPRLRHQLVLPRNRNPRCVVSFGTSHFPCSSDVSLLQLLPRNAAFRRPPSSYYSSYSRNHRVARPARVSPPILAVTAYCDSFFLQRQSVGVRPLSGLRRHTPCLAFRRGSDPFFSRSRIIAAASASSRSGRGVMPSQLIAIAQASAALRCAARFFARWTMRRRSAAGGRRHAAAPLRFSIRRPRGGPGRTP